MNEDFIDFLAALVAADVRFLVVGAHALAIHGVPRATGDLDIWIERHERNAERVWNALLAFGAPAEAIGITRADLMREDTVIQIGLPPRRIDLLTELSGVSFTDAWNHRAMETIGAFHVPFIGRSTLIANKRATGRTKDLADLEALDPPRDHIGDAT